MTQHAYKPTLKHPSLPYQQMLLRGRLRLGALANPWHCAFVAMFLSLGFKWPFWLRQGFYDVAFHLDKPQLMGTFPRRIWVYMIPGYHMMLCYRLAQLILEMEVQNGYRATSPVLAFTLSLCPPCVMFYIQRGLNRHWLLHTKHFTSTQSTFVLRENLST